MLFRKYIVSTRTLFQLTVALVFFFVAAVGAAVAANSGNAPLLVPYTVTTVAGTPQFSYAASPAVVVGFGGDAGPAVPFETFTAVQAGTYTTGATLSSPFGFAIDSVGNVYIADHGNDLIREVNFQTGYINTIAGFAPTGCKLQASTYNAFSCSAVSGCADGAPAYASKVGSGLWGVAVDSFGNVYFTDTTSKSVSVVYRGGTRVANFISLVNPAAAPTPASVQVGYVYHIAGTVSLSTPTATGTCAGSSTNNGLLIDNAPAFENINAPPATPAATIGNPTEITLDSAGNIYVADTSNNTMRVINTQATPQTFFQYTVQPGYMRSITQCNAQLTVSCVGAGHGLVTGAVGTGINGPANGTSYTSMQWASADAYGNIYQLNGASGVVAPTYASATYAGGVPLTNLLTAEAPYLQSTYSSSETLFPVPASDIPTPNELPLTYGNTYITLGNPSISSTLPGAFLAVMANANQSIDIRSTSFSVDIFGNFWYYDNHYSEVFRIDQYTSDATGIMWGDALTSSPQRATTANVGLITGNKVTNSNGTVSDYNTGKPASLGNSATSTPALNPWNCVYGASNNPWTQGPQTYSVAGDGCPASVARFPINEKYATNSDGLGNLYVGEFIENIIREVPLGTQFPATPLVGTVALPKSNSVTQAIEVHFDVSNPPVTGGAGTPPTVTIPDGPALGYTAGAGVFTIAPGPADFKINTTDPEFPLGSLNVPITGLPMGWGENATTANFQMWTGAPTCTQLGASTGIDTSYDCLVYVTFNPQQPGLRTGQLVVTTANGSVYNFQLTGVGLGGQVAIDGGQQAVVSATGLGKTSSVDVTTAGTVYIADPSNNRIVVEPAGGGAQTAITTMTGVTPTTLNNPMGIALDAANNLYIADTNNNRILKYNPITGAATQLGNYLWVPGATCDTPGAQAANCKFAGYTVSPTGSGFVANASESILNEPGAAVTPTVAPPQYAFKAPQGLAVDEWGNVYVADTGNAAVVEIPSNTALGGATPLMQYPGSTTTFVNPVAVAIGPINVTAGQPPSSPATAIGTTLNDYIFVADTGNPFNQIVRLPPGGGDLQPANGSTPGSALSIVVSAPLVGGQSISIPNGVAVDAAGNVFVSDSGTNQVLEVPYVGAPSLPYALSFSGLNSPAGLALDANGNLYVADSGNKQVLLMNRQNPTVPFGTVPQSQPSPAQPLCGNTTLSNGLNIGNSGNCVLTVSNTGNKPVTLTSPFLGAVSNGQFSITTAGHLNTCTSPIPVGAICTISPFFTPSSSAGASGSFTVNGTQSVALTANGASPEALVVLTPSNPAAGTAPNYTAAAGAETIKATVTQPHTPPGGTPTGTVTFTYTITPTVAGVSCGAPGSATVNLVAGVANYTMPALTTGLVYTVNAVYNGDTNNNITPATPIVLTVPGTPVTVTATSVTYQYGNAVPAITGTVTPNPSPVTYSFTSGATPTSAVGIYNVQVSFAGTGACAYGFPPTGATVTETKAPLTVTIPAYTTVYGAATFNYASGMVVTGLVGTDRVSATFTPADSSVLAASATPYVVTATMTGKAIGNYTITPNPPTGSDLVAPAPSGMTITAAKTSLLVTTGGTGSTVTGATYTISVSTLIAAGKGIPTGTVSVTDNFVPITSTVFIPTPPSGTFPLNASGAVTWPASDILIPSCSSTVTTNCNPVMTLAAGSGTFTLPNLNTPGVPPIGTHYLSFVYSGDSNFSCSVNGQLATSSCVSTGTTPYALIVDNPDFTLSSTTGPISLLPGNIPNGNGLPTLPNQNTSNPQSAILSIGGVLAFGGTTAPGSPVALSCQVLDPIAATYMTCAVGQVQVINGVATQPQPLAYVLNGATVAVVFEVQTPITLPLGFNTGKLRTSATRTVLAFLPFGVLAFCVRRRRRLSKALWMLIAIAAVSVGMSGCGGNQVDIYTPIPTGQKLVQVNASYTFNSAVPGQPSVTRSYVIPVNIN